MSIFSRYCILPQEIRIMVNMRVETDSLGQVEVLLISRQAMEEYHGGMGAIARGLIELRVQQ